MGSEEVVRQGLRVPFGRGYEVPPPSARVGLRSQRLTLEVIAAQESGQALDVKSLAESLGGGPDYDPRRDLLGADLFEEMLDDLTVEEFDRVTRAMGIWVMPGATREMAEASLADPMVATPPNRAARRARKPRAAASTGDNSKGTGAS